MALNLRTGEIQVPAVDPKPQSLTLFSGVASGMPRKSIPEAVNLNPHTTDFVIRAIYGKLHFNCATASVSVAVRERLLEEPPSGA